MKNLLGPLSLLLAIVVTGCSGDDTASIGGETTGTEIEVGSDNALQWGDGDYGVVLAHGAAFDAASWEDQATEIADQGATVIAVEDISPGSIAAAVEQLQGDGVDAIALVGGSAGADAILQLASEQPDLPDQLILLSPNTVVEGLGEEPKLFFASEDEPGADIPQKLADVSPGNDNVVMIQPGDAHAQNVFDTDQGDDVLDAMLERLAR